MSSSTVQLIYEFGAGSDIGKVVYSIILTNSQETIICLKPTLYYLQIYTYNLISV